MADTQSEANTVPFRALRPGDEFRLGDRPRIWRKEADGTAWRPDAIHPGGHPVYVVFSPEEEVLPIPESAKLQVEMAISREVDLLLLLNQKINPRRQKKVATEA